MQVLMFQRVSKGYENGGKALREVSFRVSEREFAALAGPSGSGKTTILNLAAGLDIPSEGRVSILGQDLQLLNEAQRTRLRSEKIGFIFQSYNLFPVLSAVENVEYPLALRRVAPKQRRERAAAALAEVGLKDMLHRRPNMLSGGQQQRVAIARAIVTGPAIILADEPTANLDSRTAAQLLELFQELNRARGVTFLFSSHDPRVLQVAHRVIHLVDGQIDEQMSMQKRVRPDVGDVLSARGHLSDGECHGIPRIGSFAPAAVSRVV